MSADGKIAAKDGSSKLSSESDLKDLHELRAAMDALMVGVNTVIVDDPLLTNRSGKGRSPIRVVVDSRLRIPLGSRVLQDLSRHPTLVSCCSSASHEKISELKEIGARVLVVDGDGGQVELAPLLRILRKQEGVERLLLEGGSELNWSMLSRGLVDEVKLTITPVIVGGTLSKSLVGGEGFRSISDSLCLKLIDYKIRSETGEVVLRYGVI